MDKYKKYKNTETKLLSIIPSHWTIKKLSTIFNKIGSGTTPKTDNDSYYSDKGEYWLASGDINYSFINDTKKKITKTAILEYKMKKYDKGSIAIAMYGASIGKIGILGMDSYVNQACCMLSNPKNENNKFLFYFLLNYKNDFITQALTGTQPNINQELVKGTYIGLPSNEEQTAIANFLDKKTGTIDSAVKELIKQRDLLKELKQATIHKAVTKGLDDNAPMKDSGVEWIGEIPVDWELARWKNILKILNGFAFKSDDHCEDGIPIVKMSNLKKGKLYLDNAQRVKRDKLHSSYFLKEGDLLLGMSGSIENFAFVGESDGECLLNQRVCKIIPIKTTNKYISYFIQGNSYRSKIKINAQGTAIMNLSTEDLKNMEIPLPSKEFQASIVKYLNYKTSKIDSSLEEIESKIDFLKEYKKTLINDAVTGKIKVYEGCK